MMHLTLNDPDRQQLAPPWTTTADHRRHDRGQALWMADRGRRHPQSAADLRVPPRPLPRGLTASGTRGRHGLRSRGAPRRAPRLPETVAPEMIAGVTHGPAGGGLDRATWTAAALAPSLEQPPGRAGSARPRRACCATPAGRPSRPTSP